MLLTGIPKDWANSTNCEGVRSFRAETRQNKTPAENDWPETSRVASPDHFREVTEFIRNTTLLFGALSETSRNYSERAFFDWFRSARAILLGPGQTVLPAQATSSQFFHLDGVGCRLATHFARVGRGWIELAWIRSSSNLRPTPASRVFHCLATSANSNQVVLLLLGDCAVVVRQLKGFLESWLRLASTVWPPADASFDYVTWLELGVPFGQGLNRVLSGKKKKPPRSRAAPVLHRAQIPRCPCFLSGPDPAPPLLCIVPRSRAGRAPPTCVDDPGRVGAEHAQLDPLLQQARLLARVQQVDLHVTALRAPGVQHGRVRAVVLCRRTERVREAKENEGMTQKRVHEEKSVCHVETRGRGDTSDEKNGREQGKMRKGEIEPFHPQLQ